MKKTVLIIGFVLFYVGILSSQAQTTPYKHSVGGAVGFLNGASYKAFVTHNLATQIDGGVAISIPYYVVTKLNFNMMYETYIKKGFYWFVGAGVGVGNTLTPLNPYYDSGYIFYMSYNLIGGAEYKFANIPLALQADIRPGLTTSFARGDVRVFPDINCLTISARYTF